MTRWSCTRGVRRACMVEGMSTREAARVFGLHRDTVRKMLKYSVPPRYRRQSQPRRPKLDSNRALNPTGTDQVSNSHPSTNHQPQINPTLWIQPA